MKHRNIVSAAFLFFLGLSVLIKGTRLGMKANLQVGPGFFPFVMGLILVLLSLTLIVQSVMAKGGGGEKRPFWSKQHGWKLVLLTLSATIAYPIILNHLGFLLSTFFLLLFLFRVIGHLRWRVACLGGAIAASVVYLMFEVWLKANLPGGILSF